MAKGKADATHVCPYKYFAPSRLKRRSIMAYASLILHRGIIPRAMNYIFHNMELDSGAFDYSVTVQYLEIYNERIVDLLRDSGSSPTANAGTGMAGIGAIPGMGTPAPKAPVLELREDSSQGVHVPGATKIPVATLSEVLSVLWRGARNRAMSATDMNERSSRSHTIFQVQVRKSARGCVGYGDDLFSKISLVDLAGSEKWKTHQLQHFSEQRIKVRCSYFSRCLFLSPVALTHRPIYGAAVALAARARS